MTKAKETFNMYGTLLAIALGAGGVVWSAGFQASDIRHLEKQVTQLEKKQSTVTTIQVEQAVQGTAIENLTGDVGEIKQTQKEISTSVELSRREVNRLGIEQNRNFQKLLDAMSHE